MILSNVLIMVPFMMGMLITVSTSDMSKVEQCRLDTEALVQGTNETMSDVIPEETCHINFDVGNSCVVDYAYHRDTAQKFCSDVGAQYHEQDIVLECVIFLDKNRNGKFSYLNFPSCVAKSCNITEIGNEIDNMRAQAMSSELSSQGINCKVSVSSSRPINVMTALLVGLFSAMVAVTILA